MIDKLKNIKYAKKRYDYGARFLADEYHIKTKDLTSIELEKRPLRFDVINYLLGTFSKGGRNYLEIGVRNPEHNFNKILAETKYSVDPGVEFESNPVDFKMTSDVFFEKLDKGEVLSNTIKFDVIFIDGLHLAEQVNRDIENALKFVRDDGFIVLHDCNPPTEYHAREDYYYELSPARKFWNGTVWKALYRSRFNKDISCCCIDSDWGIGIISKGKYFGDHLKEDFNPFLEYVIFDQKRQESLNLLSFDALKNRLTNSQ